MNNERTFGIEFETVGKHTRPFIQTRLENAFNQAGIDHTVRISGYGHDTTSSNHTVWNLKTDSSINSRVHNGYKYGMELVSPVLKGEDGLKAVKIAAQILDKYTKINKSCGLHVHHGVTNQEMLDTCGTWMKAENTIVNCLPNSRKNNHYCKTWKKYLRSTALNGSDGRVIQKLKRTRYLTLNLTSFTLRGTLEFRCAAGTTDHQKAINWILTTQAFIEASKNATANVELDTIEKVKSFIAPAVTAVFRSRSQIVKAAYEMIKTGQYAAKEVIQKAVENGYSYNAAKSLVYNSRHARYTTFGQTTEFVNGKIRFVQSSGSPLYNQAAEWLGTRFELFNC